MLEFFEVSDYHSLMVSTVPNRLVLLDGHKLRLFQLNPHSEIDSTEITSTVRENDYVNIVFDGRNISITYESIHGVIQNEYYIVIDNKISLVGITKDITNFVFMNNNTIVHNNSVIVAQYDTDKLNNRNVKLKSFKPVNLFNLTMQKGKKVDFKNPICGASICKYDNCIILIGGTNHKTGLRSHDDLYVMTNGEASLLFKNILKGVEGTIKDYFFIVKDKLYLFDNNTSYTIDLYRNDMTLRKHKDLSIDDIRSIIVTPTEIYVLTNTTVVTIVN